MSDSNDLVRHVAEELFDPQFVSKNLPTSSSTNNVMNDTIMIDPKLYQQVMDITKPSSRSLSNKDFISASATSNGGGGRIVARDVSTENVHIDRQKGRPPSHYYGTFIDLLLAMHAKCVVFGIGYYAEFAAHISGTKCEGIYQKESWGEQVPKDAYTCV